jgi:hypothetical protein
MTDILIVRDTLSPFPLRRALLYTATMAIRSDRGAPQPEVEPIVNTVNRVVFLNR